MIFKRATLAALALLGWGCQREAPPQPSAAEPAVRSDLAGLRQYLNLPEGDYACKWVLRSPSQANSRAPGPSDYAVTAFVELDERAWSALPVVQLDPPDPMNDLPGSTEDSLMLKPAFARTLLPSALLQGAASAPGDFIVLRGQAVAKDGLGKSAIGVTRALKLGNGLLVSLHTR